MTGCGNLTVDLLVSGCRGGDQHTTSCGGGKDGEANSKFSCQDVWREERVASFNLELLSEARGPSPAEGAKITSHFTLCLTLHTSHSLYSLVRHMCPAASKGTLVRIQKLLSWSISLAHSRSLSSGDFDRDCLSFVVGFGHCTQQGVILGGSQRPGMGSSDTSALQGR